MHEYLHSHNPGGVLMRPVCHDIRRLHRCQYRRECTATIYFGVSGYEWGRIRKGGHGHGSSILESSKVYLRPAQHVSGGRQKNSGQNGPHAIHKTSTNPYPLGEGEREVVREVGGRRRRIRVEEWAQVVAKGGYIWTGNDRKQTVVHKIGIEIHVLIKYYGSISLF
jgi:hypothetical protein